ncbi:MAG: hypothetical protein Q4A46_05775 [Clostridia bacterium]|nr:hypothetical protein [Clostridia bacterium]
MTTDELMKIAEESTQNYNAEKLSELFEQESRRYSRRLSEEEEAKLR